MVWCYTQCSGLYYAVKRIMHGQCSFNAMDNAWKNNALNRVSNAWFDLISSQTTAHAILL